MEIEYRNARFVGDGVIDVEVNHPALGWVPFTALVSDIEPFGAELYYFLLGRSDVAPYVPPPPPTPDELRAAMPPLQKWRVDTIIDLEPGLREKINAAIEAMDEPNRTISKNKLASVTEFLRTDPLFELIGGDPSIGKTPEDIDAMWQAALALK
ncbi:hypothetical protein [Brucella sp. IR073]|uniref:hypothetical protein n=1 Tax=unclassified Brucella TaxID=2632610 RepID=UPI003B97DC12